ncbi:hypothetical protein RN001_007323 [Aquatica leii]|uniref:Uncharacterized protein n=1 Tax=Aquatica leii TaxID=1421715 RepID=A0AAN7P858_9COLE|nr:hypothetical protein RN001_007323 [Aquatica leii]
MNQPKTLSCGTSSNIHDSQPLAEVFTAIQGGASTTTWVPKQLVATSISSPQLPGCSSNSAPTTPSSSALKTTKNLRSRTLYSFRKKQLDIEEQRVKQIDLLRQAVERSNEIQKERNELLKKLVDKK